MAAKTYSDDRAYLRACTGAYEQLVAMLRRSATDDDRLRWVRLAAEFAGRHHPGRFVDGRLESTALDVGRRLGVVSAPGFGKPHRHDGGSRRHLLHVLTQAPAVGGHVRLVRSWIEKDAVSTHSVAVLEPPRRGPGLPDWLRKSVDASGGAAVVLPHGSACTRSAHLRAVVTATKYAAVVLHHHPYDVVPLVALATEVDIPPVALMNHADHMFGLGVSVADTVIDFRGYGERLTRDRRLAGDTCVLPLPVYMPGAVPRRHDARQRLGIPADQCMLLSIGSAYKFTPAGAHDFFGTARRILDRHPAAHIYVIGVPPCTAGDHPRLHRLGVIEDAVLYQAAADVYLEGFPYGGLTALLESSALGAAPVLMFGPSQQQSVAEDPGLIGLVANPTDEDRYLATIAQLVDDPAARARLAGAVQRSVMDVHLGAGWLAAAERVCSRLVGRPHRPAPIPATPPAETEDDLALAQFDRSRDSGVPLLSLAAKQVTSLGDVIALWSASRRSGDSLLTWRDTRTWLSRLWRVVSRRRGD